MSDEISETKEKVVIFGTGSFAEVAYYYFMKDSPYKVVAFTVDRGLATSDTKFGLPVVFFDAVEKRITAFRRKTDPPAGYPLPGAIHPTPRHNYPRINGDFNPVHRFGCIPVAGGKQLYRLFQAKHRDLSWHERDRSKVGRHHTSGRDRRV